MTEAKLLVREPLALFWGLVFPMALLAVMGLSSSDIGGVPLVTIYEPIVIAFVGVVFGVQGIPVQVAGYRERRILRRLATTPAGPVRVVAAQLIVSLVVVLAATAGVLAVGRLGFGVPLPRQPAGFVLVAVLSATAMLALGLLIGAVAPTARSAGAAGTVLFFPLMYFAGLWTPQMSASAKHIGQFTPLGAATQALGDSMNGGWPHPAAFAVLGLCTVVCAGLAARFFRWE
ncbi:ABC transporter permease [Trebonia sp.]|uniref:ABC transporter permease n=1 Tax=Trebonia sp. TaxID=2767075 RepID=UPI003CC648C3